MVLIYIQHDLKNAGIDVDGKWKNEIYTKLQHSEKDNSKKEIKKKKNEQQQVYY